MSEGDVCLVCLWPRQQDTRCGHCRRGPTSPDDTDGLADWQHDYDLEAAARAASATAPDDDVLLSLLGRSVRGAEPTGDEIKRAVSKADRLANSNAGMVFAMTRLVAGQTSAVSFVEIGPDLVSWQALVTNESGTPVPGPARVWQWTDIVPSLPDVLGLRYLRMAGGIGRSDSTAPPVPAPAMLSEMVRESLSRVLTRVSGAAKTAAALYRSIRLVDDPDGKDAGDPPQAAPFDTVLVLRTAKWPLLDDAADAVRAAMRPVTEIAAGPLMGTLADVVQAMADLAPLRYGYDLILVQADRRSGAVRPQPFQLFPPGAAGSPDDRPVRAVPVSPVAGYTATQLTLPIVVQRGPLADLRDLRGLQEQRPLIAAPGLHTEASGPFRLRVELAGPAQIRLLAHTEFQMTDVPGDWPGVIADLPERLWLPPRLSAGSLDLVLLVELGSADGRDGKDVAARMRLVRELVREFHDVPQARLAVLGFRDHNNPLHQHEETGRAGRERHALVVGSTAGFGTPEDLRSRLGATEWWRPVEARDNAAPVEEVLNIIAKDKWNWRSDARHVVLTVGQRPPHPPRHRTRFYAHRCTQRLSWEEDVGRLQKAHQAEFLAVLDGQPHDGYAADTWQVLASAGRFLMGGGTTARMLAERCGLAPRSSVQLRLAEPVILAPPPASGRESR